MWEKSPLSRNYVIAGIFFFPFKSIFTSQKRVKRIPEFFVHVLPYEGALTDRGRQSREEIAVPLSNVCRHKDCGAENRCQGNLLPEGTRLGEWGVNSIDSTRRRALGCPSWAIRRHLAWYLLFSSEWSKRKMQNQLTAQEGKAWMCPCCSGTCNIKGALRPQGDEWPLEERKNSTGKALLLLIESRGVCEEDCFCYFRYVRDKTASAEEQGGLGPKLKLSDGLPEPHFPLACFWLRPSLFLPWWNPFTNQ